jgi:hypothetical protein
MTVSELSYLASIAVRIESEVGGNTRAGAERQMPEAGIAERSAKPSALFVIACSPLRLG